MADMRDNTGMMEVSPDEWRMFVRIDPACPEWMAHKAQQAEMIALLVAIDARLELGIKVKTVLSL